MVRCSEASLVDVAELLLAWSCCLQHLTNICQLCELGALLPLLAVQHG